MIFDTHAHYDDRRFKADLHELLARLPGQGVSLVLNAGATMKSSKAGITLAEKYEYIYAAVGVHPHDVKDINDGDLETLKSWCRHKKVVAVGETGLDYHYDYSPRDLQVYWFKKQLELSRMVSLPVIIHSREACKETFDIVKESGVTNGVVHCFSGSAQVACDYLKLGFYIGIGGVITFKNAKKLIEVVEAVPMERLLIETDAPYLAPEPERGSRNDSTLLKFVAEKIAQIKGISGQEVEKITEANGKKLFGII